MTPSRNRGCSLPLTFKVGSNPCDGWVQTLAKAIGHTCVGVQRASIVALARWPSTNGAVCILSYGLAGSL